MTVVAGIRVSPDHFIGGERVAGDGTFEVRSPIDESVIAEVARGGAREVDLAVAAAERAFPAWAALGPGGRAEHLRRLADLVDANVDRLAEVECLDMAMLLRSLRARVISRGARNFRAYAELAEGYSERSWSSNGTANRVLRIPSGPVAVITPWNAPFMLSTWKTAPALAAGCTVILKPPEWAPLSCSLLCDLVAEAGLPAGVFNVVQGIGEEAGAALVADPRLRRVSFTGSTDTGRLIAQTAGRNLVPFTAELGGKGPFVVLDDADLDAAAAKAANMYDDSGQNCMAGTRLLVDESIADGFLERFHALVDRHVLGDPRDDETTISPVIHRTHLERIDGFVQRARANGDRIVRGGRVAERGGLWYEPTLVEPRSNDSEIVQHEVFGPVLTFQAFHGEDEAVALANSTGYGLAATVWSGSSERAERVGRAVRAGTVWANTFLVRDLTAPFGGVGLSGIGREGGDYALDFYSDLKTLQILEGERRVTALTLADVDLSHDVFAAGIPHETFALLRRSSPVHWYDWPLGKGFWCVTKHADLIAVSKDTRTYSSEVGATALEDLEPDQIEARKSMLDMDPPRHSRLRGLVAQEFTPRTIKGYEGALRELTRHVLDRALPHGEAASTVELDFVEEIAKELPIRVLAQLLGVPDADTSRLVDWGDRCIGNTDPEYTDVLHDSADSDPYRLVPFRSPASLELFDYGHWLARERRDDPRDDLVSKLVHAEIDGERLTEQEFDTMFLLLVIAGNETTRQAIAHGMQALMDHRDQWARLDADPDLIWRSGADELLRWATPVLHFRRTATVDTVLRDQPIAAGDKVVVWYVSADFDEEVFDDPYRFDVGRRPNPHVVFGGGGPHFCLGAHLARLEVQVMFAELLPRIADLEPTGPVERVRTNFTNALKRMPVRVTLR